LHSLYDFRSVDLLKAIRQLYEEREKLDQVIASLEELQKSATHIEQGVLKKRRGRKSMDPQARKEVSERMKRYWASRRKNKEDKS